MHINIDPVAPLRAMELIRNIIPTGIPFFIHGEPGIGKSEIVEQIAAERNMKLTVQMLTQMEATDLRGLQFVDDVRKVTVNYPPSWLPTKDDDPTIIFLDELPSAEPRLQVAAYQLLLSRRIGDFVLDKKHYVCGAGNRVDDGAVVYEMGTALASRLMHIAMMAEPRSWLDWASKHNVHPIVMTFIQLKGHMLTRLEDQLKSQNLIGPNPRQWNRVSEVVTSVGTKNRNIIEPMVEGLIGKAATKDFFLTVEEMSGLPDPRIILDMDPKDFVKIIPEKLPNLWGLAFSIISYAATKEQMVKATMFFRLIVEQGPKNQPLEDVRKMGMEILIEKANKAKLIQELSREKEIRDYMAFSERVLAIDTR
jgi:hypothetical protein